MALDVLEAGFAQDGTDSAEFRAQGFDWDLIVKLLQRDDPMRRLYLQRRWRHPHLPIRPMQDSNLEGTSCSNRARPQLMFAETPCYGGKR